MKGVYAELKRRNVFRVAVTYAVAAWIVAQVAGLAADAFVAPPWVMQMIITALIIGFLPAVVVAWAFELTPEGIRRERDLVDHDAVSRYTAKRLDIAVIILLVLAIGLIFVDRYLLRSAPSEPLVAELSQDWHLDSIAVLPFADFSPDRDQSWLGEGIADTLLHALAQVDDLRVSARSSSFAYRERQADVATIGRELGVATVLEGSVQRFGQRLRVTAQLVRTDTQAQLFSRTFERELDDIFAIQDEIAAAVTEALLGSTRPGPAAAARTATEVYDWYLEGRQLWQERNQASVNRAVLRLEQAVNADPNYAPAQAELAIALLFTVFYGEAELDQVRSRVEQHADRALALDRDNALAWAARGHLLEQLGLADEALDAFVRAERLDPGNANIQVWTGNRYFEQGRFADAAQRFERALELDPLNQFVRQRYLNVLGNLNSQDPRMERIARDTLRLFPEIESSWASLLNLISSQGRSDEQALLAFDAHRTFPEQGQFVSWLAASLDSLGFDEAAGLWRARAGELGVDMDSWIGFALLERDPEQHLALARSIHERQGSIMLSMLLQSLRINGKHEEAFDLFRARYEMLEQRFESGAAGLEDYNILPEGYWLARLSGENELAERLSGLFVDKVNEVRDLGIFGSFEIPDLLIALMREDLDAASQLLDSAPPSSWSYLEAMLRIDPLYAELAATPAGARLREQSESRRRQQVERLRTEAPAELLHP
ncbi:MAG: tetratricopeptide repeat protein [Wenzhouxiangella sp.]|nr:MAG: tetratricopeptide repeat protein [Wenzhouxiangella sp.]